MHKVAVRKERPAKRKFQEQFDEEITDEIKNRNTLFKRFKKPKLHINKDIYNVARYKVRKMIFSKKGQFFFKKISKSIGKLKDLWKALNSIGLPNDIFSCEVSALEINYTVEHDANSVSEGFKNYDSTLAENFVKMFLSINSIKFPDLFKIAKFNPLNKKRFFNFSLVTTDLYLCYP